MPDVRPARSDDFDSIVAWTTDTFSWGDYVPRRFHTWLEDPESELIVCVDETDSPIALANVVMLSSLEGWMEAARVHPDHRREGLGSALNQAGVNWAREQGARVVRLATETTNTAAMSQVETLEYRAVSEWVYGQFDVDPTARCDDQFRMKPANTSDAEAAWMAWSASELAHDGREFLADGWRWRKARPEDALGAAAEGQMVRSAAGWVTFVELDERIETRWISTNPGDLIPLIEGLLEMAAARGIESVSVKLPSVAWTTEALKRTGAEEPTTLTVWAKPI